MAGAHAGAADLFERLFQVLCIRVTALRQIGLHAQASQRCFELVRCVCQETFLGGDRIFEAGKQIIERGYQGRNLFWNVIAFQGAHVIGLALTNPLAQSVERFYAVAQSQPYQQDD